MKQVLCVASAFVGVAVGVDFTTGQEIIQYFVAFGINGVWGAVLLAVIMSLTVIIILELGSYFWATEHGEVFRRVSYPIFSRTLDTGVTITLFATGFVVFAGVGANTEQRWGPPVWIGAVTIVLVTIAAGFSDADRVTTMTGSITLFTVGFTLLASIYTLMFADATPAVEQVAVAVEVPTTLPNWAVAAMNHVGFNLMVAVSMVIVIGGSLFNPRAAGAGGFTGGLIYSVMLLTTTITLFHTVGIVAIDAVSMFAVINHLHPRLGQTMAVAILSMIFNTALGMFYALGRRVTAKHLEKFKIVYAGLVLLDFASSLAGFQNLIDWIYPILDYIGLLLITVMFVAWLRGRERISEEASRCKCIFRPVHRGRRKEVREEIEDSNLSVEEVREAIEE